MEPGSWEERVGRVDVGVGMGMEIRESEGVLRRGEERKSPYRNLLEAVPPLVGPGSGSGSGVRSGEALGSNSKAASRTGAERAESACLSSEAGGGYSAGSAVATNYVEREYAFSVADNSRAGPRKPARYRGGIGVRAWPGLGAAVPPRVVRGFANVEKCGLGEGTGDAGISARGKDMNNYMGGGEYMVMCEELSAYGYGYGHAYAQYGGAAPPEPSTLIPTITRTMSNIAQVARSQGYGTGTRSGSKCQHRRCEGCYDVNAEKQVMRFCGGNAVDLRQYEAWYRSFNFLDGVEPLAVDGGLRGRRREWFRGGGVPVLVLDREGDGGGDEEGERNRGSMSLREYNDVRLGRTGYERMAYRDPNTGGEKGLEIQGEDVLVSRSENAALEMRLDDPSCSRSGTRERSLVRYTTGESRILLVRTEGSDDGDVDDDNDNSQKGKAAKASSDEGGQFIWESGNGDGGDKEESSSDGGSHGWIEEITFIHRGSQEGGGCSDSGSDNESQRESQSGNGNGDEEGEDGDDEREEDRNSSDDDANSIVVIKRRSRRSRRVNQRAIGMAGTPLTENGHLRIDG